MVIRVENHEQHPSDQKSLTLYNQVQSLQRFINTQFTATTTSSDNCWVDKESDDESSEEENADNKGHATHLSIEEEEEESNKYLVEVRKRFQSHFKGMRNVRMIGYKSDEITYKLPKGVVPLSKIFEVMETMKRDDQLHIINYTISQSNLEQVIICMQFGLEISLE